MLVRILILFGLVALFFPLALGFAQVVPDPGNPDTFVQAVLNAVAAEQWGVVAILVAVAAVYVLRLVATRLPGALGAFFATKRGGAVTALLGGIVTALAGFVLGGKGISVPLLLSGLVLGIGAAGGWNVVKDLIWGDAPRPDLYPPKT